MGLHYTVKKKVCSCCGEEKPLTEFYMQSYTGIPSAQCKTCVNVKRAVQRDKRRTSKFIAKERQRGMTKNINYSLGDWKAAMVFFGGRCAYCGKPQGKGKDDRLDKDHLIAHSKGGETVKNNIVPACRKCNRGRGNRDWEEWFKAQSFYSVEAANKIKKWANNV